jgi:hypothetical protein
MINWHRGLGSVVQYQGENQQNQPLPGFNQSAQATSDQVQNNFIASGGGQNPTNILFDQGVNENR